MKDILKLALPSIVSNITVPLLGLVDLTIVGHMGNITYIGAIAVATMMFNVIYWLCGFLRMGTSGMTSQAFGAEDHAETMRLLVRSVVIGMMIAVLLMLFHVPVKALALWAMHPSAEVGAAAGTYFSVCIAGAPAVLGMYSFTGWFIGMQDTRLPMVVAIVQNVVNILASVAFVYGFGMQIEGVAWGTLIAQWAGLLLSIGLWLHYYRHLVHTSWLIRLWDRVVLCKFFVVNRDIFLRTLFLVGVNLYFISVGAAQGDVLLSVNTLLMTLFTLFSYVMDGFAYAGEALVGKHFGARNEAGFDGVYRALMRWGLAMALCFTLLYIAGGNGLLMLLTNEKAVVQAAQPYFYWAVMIPLLGFAAFIYDGIFIGITATKGMLVAMVVAAVVFLVLYLALSNICQNHALWLAFLVYLGLRGFIQWRWLAKNRYKIFR